MGNILFDYLKKKDVDRYWKYREKYVNTNNKLLRASIYILIKKIEKKNNAEIGVSFREKCALFKGKPFFPHGLNGIVISTKATIGYNAVILHQVTIGTTMVKERAKAELSAPRIGNNVYIGAGAKIIGDINVGDNCIIGANAVVVKDIPSNCTAIGVPARIIPNSNHFLFPK